MGRGAVPVEHVPRWLKRLCPCRCCVQVTSKDGEQESGWTAFRRALAVTWPHLTYYAAFLAGCIYFIVVAVVDEFR